MTEWSVSIKKYANSLNVKHKVFTHMSADLNKQLGQPDLFVLLQIQYRTRW